MHRTIIRGSSAAVLVSCCLAAPLLAQCPPPFQRGDSNQDNRLDLSDPITTPGYLSLGAQEPGCLESADADDSGTLDLTDAVYTVGYLFLGQAPIPPPVMDDCGSDPTPDSLGCVAYLPCRAGEVVPCTDNGCCALGE